MVSAFPKLGSSIIIIHHFRFSGQSPGFLVSRFHLIFHLATVWRSSLGTVAEDTQSNRGKLLH